MSARRASVVRDCVGQQNSRHRLDVQSEPNYLVHHRGKTVTKLLPLSPLGLPSSEKQIPQVVENLESGGEPKEALEKAALRPRQVRYQAALRPDSLDSSAPRYSSASFAEECADILRKKRRLLQAGEMAAVGHFCVAHQVVHALQHAAGRL